MSDAKTIKNINEFVEKFDHMKKQNKLDLSSDQDLTFAIMHLISIEEHFIFTGAKTEKNQYYDLVKDVREMRKTLMEQVVDKPEGEVWCISKHLMGASMRLMEVGTKQLGMDKKEIAYDFFQKAYDMYALFWGLNMKLIDTGKVKKIDDNAINKNDKSKKGGVMGSLGALVKKAIDCCIE